MKFDGINSTLEYGRDLVNSGIEGAISARNHNLNGKCAEAVVSESVLNSLIPAAIGASVGLLAGLLGSRKSPMKALAYGLAGGAVGFGGAMLWNTRELTGDMARSAARNISGVRDAHWLKKNPVNYG